MGEFFEVAIKQGTLNDTYSFTPTLINQAVFSVLNSRSSEIQSTTITQIRSELTCRNIRTARAMSERGQQLQLRNRYSDKFEGTNYQIRDGVNWIKGRHNMKFGFESFFLNFRQLFLEAPGFTFSGVRSGDPIADFMLGAYDNLNVAFGRALITQDYTVFNSFSHRMNGK